ncbi:MAG: ABC transporter permease [Xanthomonadales bacterium]|nr:ABC transporter permease [Xanthomonadales bacterium]
MSLLLDETRNAIRGVVARPAFSALVVGVLAAGLACVIFMLAMLNGFVLRPLPFTAPDQLLHAGLRGDDGNDLNPVPNAELIAIGRQLDGVADSAGFARSTMNLSDLDRPERFTGAYVSSNLFRTLGVAPSIGRDFSATDATDGAASVAMISNELWQSRYGGDPAIIGRQIRVNAQAATVVGVMPPNFSYPTRESIWLAGHLFEGVKADDLSWWVVLRRHADVSDAAVTTAFENWFNAAAQAQPERFRGMQAGIEPLAYLAVSPTIRAVLGIMLAAVFMVLLVACANAANLLLTRTLGRKQELAVRFALGASRRRLIVHLLGECLLLSLLALAVAFPLASLGIHWQQALMRQSDPGPPLWLRFDMDATVVGLAFASALVTALLTGLFSALRVGGDGVADQLRDGTRSVASGSFARISRVLVIGEIALSCALLISVGTMVRGISALDHVDLGIQDAQLLSARILLSNEVYATAAEQTQLYERLGERLREDAEVVDATVGTAMPGTNVNETRSVVADGTVVGDGPLPRVRYGAIDNHFLDTYAIKLQQGRHFDSRDSAEGQRVAIVDQQFATRYGVDQSVLGRQFRLDPRDPEGTLVTVVGIVGGLKLDGPMDSTLPAMLVPLSQSSFRLANVVVRTRGEPLAFSARLREIMRTVDADTPLYWIRDFPGVMRNQTLGERMVAQSFGVFGILALLLAGAGLYGVVAFSVTQRTREIGVRRALGAPSRQMLRSLFGRTVFQLSIGLGIGLALGVPFAQMLSGSLPGMATSNTPIILIVLGVLILAALLAVIIPARRALRIDPMVALRHE